ncbi:hypothetical protein JYU34_003028 [Plutella xylostella]|uniref:Uncharacterized protein n=1 Tax=Plutella xylostella TaxID=51655 RepID=A0ABQ7QZ26_PLUXY|nr:hypothetical protein JYU34_003028 [Plutella xylostella]
MFLKPEVSASPRVRWRRSTAAPLAVESGTNCANSTDAQGATLSTTGTNIAAYYALLNFQLVMSGWK